MCMAVPNWVLDGNKFLSIGEVNKLLRVARARALEAQGIMGRVEQRNYLVVNLGLSTGLRVGEMANLKCGDIFLGDGASALVVRRGKGGKARRVAFNGAFREHLQQYLRWKEAIGEPVTDEAPLFLSPATGKALTTRALQKAFKRCAAWAGLSPHYSIHSLRHTYACHLYKASGWNLRLVQKQLGHSSIATTQIYADVMEPDVRRALTRLYR